EQVVALEVHVPRAVQRSLQRVAATLAVRALLAGTRHEADRLLLQVQRPDRVVLAVSDVKRLALQCHSLRIVETRLVERAVLQARLARTGNGDLLAIQIRNDNAMVRTVGDEESLRGGVSQDLAREEQRTAAVLAEPGQLEPDRLLVERLPLAVDLAEPRQEPVQFLVVALALVEPDGVALRIDQDQGRPRAACAQVSPPDAHVGVIDDRVVDLVAEDRLADVLAVLLVLELR